MAFLQDKLWCILVQAKPEVLSHIITGQWEKGLHQRGNTEEDRDWETYAT